MMMMMMMMMKSVSGGGNRSTRRKLVWVPLLYYAKRPPPYSGLLITSKGRSRYKYECLFGVLCINKVYMLSDVHGTVEALNMFFKH